MRAWLALVAVGLVVAPTFAFADPAGHVTVRMVGGGDAYLFSLSSTCPSAGAALDPTNPARSMCVVVHDHLGYDGLTAGYINASDHVNHPFACSITSSATAASGAIPAPANTVGGDSLRVWFDIHVFPQPSYGGRLERPPFGAVINRITTALAYGDVPTLLGVPQWYLAETEINGATPTVTGNVDGADMYVLVESGLDVTVDCQI